MRGFLDKARGFLKQASAAGSGAAIDGAVTSGTAGSVLFVAAGPILAQDNANFFWDDTNNRLGIGTATPAVALSVFPDTDGAAILGRARIDARTTDGAHFSHFDMTTTAQYAVWQTAAGLTNINSASGQVLNLQTGGSSRFQITSSGHFASTGATLQFHAHGSSLVGAPGYSFTGDPNTGFYPVGADTIGVSCGGVLNVTIGNATLGFYGTAAAAKPTVSGAHGSNAALQSLLTGLAGLGLITDSSS